MPFDPDLYKRALDFAARAHGDQRVPGSGFPYVVHVAKVAMEVLAATEDEVGLDRDLAVACALLHDAVEDAPSHQERQERLAAIRAAFGVRVADGVLALTKDDTLPKQARMPDSLARIRAQPREVWLVKLADRITNLEPPPPAWPAEKRRVYHAEAERLLFALRDAGTSLPRRLEAKLAEYARHCG